MPETATTIAARFLSTDSHSRRGHRPHGSSLPVVTMMVRRTAWQAARRTRSNRTIGFARYAAFRIAGGTCS